MPKGDKIRISELLTVHGIWIYKKIEPQRRANNKQWLCKDQARSVIVIDKKKAREKVSYSLFLNSDWPNVHF